MLSSCSPEVPLRVIASLRLLSLADEMSKILDQAWDENGVLTLIICQTLEVWKTKDLKLLQYHQCRRGNPI